jgi:hypothetical protein
MTQDILGNIDFGTVSEFTQNLPAGVYDANINSVKVETDNKGENNAERTFVAFTFKVAEGSHAGMTQPEKIMVPNFYSKLKSILGLVGFDTTGAINVRQLIATDVLLGKPIKIIVTESPGKKEGQVYTNVSGYEKSDRKAGGAPAGGAGTGLPGLPAV